LPRMRKIPARWPLLLCPNSEDADAARETLHIGDLIEVMQQEIAEAGLADARNVFQHGAEPAPSSPGDPEMTLSTSDVAVCCSSDSVSSRVRACTSSNSRTFSIAITAWSAKVVASSICLSLNGLTEERVIASRRRQIASSNNTFAGDYGYRHHVEEGGLMSYGPDIPDQYRRAAMTSTKSRRPRQLRGWPTVSERTYSQRQRLCYLCGDHFTVVCEYRLTGAR
jgi:hypothetical protein